MKNLISLLFLFCFSINAFSQKEIDGKVYAGDSAILKLSHVLPLEYPLINVLFKAEHPNGYPYWGLEKEDLLVTEGEKNCKIVYLKHFGNRKPINISLVLDHSGSMEFSNVDVLDFLNGDTILLYNPTDSLVQAYKNSGKRPIDNLKKAASNFVENFNFEKDKIGIFGFSSSVDVVLPLSNNKQKIKTEIDSLIANGATAFLDAVYMAVNKTPVSDEINIVVAISDGGDNASSKTTSEIIKLSNSKNIPVFCIGLGDVWERPLVSISDSTNGFYSYTKKSSSLDSIYNLINKKIQAVYELTYLSDNWSNDTSRNFTLKFNIEGVNLLDSNFKFSLPQEVIDKIDERNKLKNYQMIGIGGGTFLVVLLGLGFVYFKRKKKEKIAIKRMYPNPGNGLINIEFNVPKTIENIELKVISTNGSIVLTENILVTQKVLDLRKMNSGLYIISISKEGYNNDSKKYFKR